MYIWYIYLQLADFYGINVGKYTSPMDAMVVVLTALVHPCFWSRTFWGSVFGWILKHVLRRPKQGLLLIDGLEIRRENHLGDAKTCRKYWDIHYQPQLVHSPKLTEPLKIGHSKRKFMFQPTTHFKVLLLLVPGRVSACNRWKCLSHQTINSSTPHKTPEQRSKLYFLYRAIYSPVI